MQSWIEKEKKDCLEDIENKKKKNEDKVAKGKKPTEIVTPLLSLYAPNTRRNEWRQASCQQKSTEKTSIFERQRLYHISGSVWWRKNHKYFASIP